MNLPNHLDGMVQTYVVGIVATSEDAAAVKLPWSCICSHCKRSCGCQVFHCGSHVIGREGVVSCNPDYWGSFLKVIFAVACHAYKIIKGQCNCSVWMKSNDKEPTSAPHGESWPPPSKKVEVPS